MASRTRWTWVWVISGSWWWPGRPGMVQFMGWQRVGHDWATELYWTVLNWTYSLQTFFGFIGEYITPLLTLTLSAPFWCLWQTLSLSPLYFINFITQKLWVIKPCLWPWIEFFSSGGKESQCLFEVQQQPFTTPTATPWKSAYCLVYVFHMREITYYVASSIWLISLSVAFSKFMHVTWIFYCMNEPCFIHSSVDGHLGCFCTSSVVNSAIINICVQHFVWVSVIDSFGCT